MRFTLPTLALAATTALAGHSSGPGKHKAPGMLLTGCPNGYTDFVTGECKPFHLRVRDAEAGDWRSHKVTDTYPVFDHGHGPGGKNGKNGNGKGRWDGPGRGDFGHGKPGGPSHHCPNGVAFHATGECKPFRLHARDAESGEWREHRVTGAYRIPDEKPGMNGHGGPPKGAAKGFGGFGGAHGGPGGMAHGGPAKGGKPAGGAAGGKGGMFGGGPKGGMGGGRGGGW